MSEQQQQHHKHVSLFFLYICVSTALRSFEAGIISSMMSVICSDLHLDYTEEGTIAASPDYGFAPGALLAIIVFRYHAKRAQAILGVVMIGTALATWICCAYPSKASLVMARCVGGVLWAHSATHYPVWIDQRGPSQEKKTIWLACFNVALLVGVLAGYVVGGAVQAVMLTSDGEMIHGHQYYSYITRITWVKLYFLEGLLMAVCGLALMGFRPDLVRIDRQTQDQDTDSPSSPTLSDIFMTLLGSVPFVVAVAITGCLSGGVVFALYFITQVCEARGMQPSAAVMSVTAIFVTAPAPGMLFGSWAVGHNGGYTDHVVTFRVAVGSAVITLLATILFPLSWHIWGESSQLPFALACWTFFFAGGMSGPPLNGVAVSVVPRASHVASGLQFALANTAKIVVPQIGGFVCNRIGLVDGFNATLVVCAFVFLGFSWMGLVYAKRHESGYDRLP